MTDLTQITYDAKLLATHVTDLGDIARHLNRVYGKNYQPSDISKLLSGIKPTASVPRNRAPVHMRNTKLMADPIAWERPISTPQPDPLAIATLAYIERNRAKIEALAR